MNVEQIVWVGWVKVFDNAGGWFASALEESVKSPIEGGFAGAVRAVYEEVAAFEIEFELPEGFEVRDLDSVETGFHGCISPFIAR